MQYNLSTGLLVYPAQYHLSHKQQGTHEYYNKSQLYEKSLFIKPIIK
jgi:hypothetical protein